MFCLTSFGRIIFLQEFLVLKTTPMPNTQSLTDILKQLSEQNTEKVKLAVVDIDGILRGKVQLRKI